MAVDIAYMRGLNEKKRPPIVRFGRRARFDQALTDQAGRSSYVDEDIVTVTSPNGGVTVTKRVDEWFAEIETKPEYFQWVPAFKQMYADWQKSHDPTAVEGTHISNWPLVSPGQCETLLNAGCRTIEEVSKMPDELAASLDGGRYLRSKARYWINAAEDMGSLASHLAALEAENESLRVTNEQLGQNLEALRKENERLTQHFTGKEGYDIIAGRAQPVGLPSVQAAQPQQPAATPPPPSTTPTAPEPTLKTRDELKAMGMSGLRDYCYEQDIKPSNSKDETIKRLKEAGKIA